MYVSLALVDTAPELCQKGDIFPEKKDGSHIRLCFEMYAYFS